MSPRAWCSDKRITVEPLAKALGARVLGVDLSQIIGLEVLDEIRMAWQKYLVLVFPEQDITDGQQVRFSRQFGELEIYPLGDNRSQHNPEIFRVSNCDAAGQLLPADDPESLWNNLTEYWHTDSSYRTVPAQGAVLHGREVPPQGGDTLFVNLVDAFDGLPEKRQKNLENLVVVHDWQYGTEYADHLMKAMKSEEIESVPPVRHPLIRTDRSTGKRALFVSPAYASGIDGIVVKEARDLIAELCEWAIQPQFIYRHSWSRHDVVMWYNPLTMHAREAFDYGRERRIMHRTTIVGT